MCKTLAKAQHFAIINVQNDFSCLDNFNAIADGQKRHRSQNEGLSCLPRMNHKDITVFHISHFFRLIKGANSRLQNYNRILKKCWHLMIIV